jgi:hypothetical protein
VVDALARRELACCVVARNLLLPAQLARDHAALRQFVKIVRAHSPVAGLDVSVVVFIWKSLLGYGAPGRRREYRSWGHLAGMVARQRIDDSIKRGFL